MRIYATRIATAEVLNGAQPRRGARATILETRQQAPNPSGTTCTACGKLRILGVGTILAMILLVGSMGMGRAVSPMLKNGVQLERQSLMQNGRLGRYLNFPSQTAAFVARTSRRPVSSHRTMRCHVRPRPGYRPGINDCPQGCCHWLLRCHDDVQHFIHYRCQDFLGLLELHNQMSKL